jgi:hypothetical protein
MGNDRQNKRHLKLRKENRKRKKNKKQEDTNRYALQVIKAMTLNLG